MKWQKLSLIIILLIFCSSFVFAKYTMFGYYPFPVTNIINVANDSTYMFKDGTNSYASYLKYNTTYVPTGLETPGTIYYDNASHTISSVLEEGVILQNGQELHIYGKNTGGVDIHNGDAVSVTNIGGSFTTLSLTN